jgi:hypothetical protein
VLRQSMSDELDALVIERDVVSGTVLHDSLFRGMTTADTCGVDRWG